MSIGEYLWRSRAGAVTRGRTVAQSSL